MHPLLSQKTILVKFRILHITFSTALAVGFAQNTMDLSFHELSIGIWVDGCPTTASYSKSCPIVHVCEKIRDSLIVYTRYTVIIFSVDAHNHNNIGAPHS